MPLIRVEVKTQSDQISRSYIREQQLYQAKRWIKGSYAVTQFEAHMPLGVEREHAGPRTSDTPLQANVVTPLDLVVVLKQHLLHSSVTRTYES